MPLYDDAASKAFLDYLGQVLITRNGGESTSLDYVQGAKIWRLRQLGKIDRKNGQRMPSRVEEATTLGNVVAAFFEEDDA